MNEVQLSLLSHLPSRRKNTPSGWTSFNSPCCHYRGEKPDSRQRGGILVNEQGGFQYHCFNCGFKAGWTPGHFLSKNTKSLFKWLGLNDTEIGQLNLYTIKVRDSKPKEQKSISLDLPTVDLPEMSMSLSEWANSDLPEEAGKELLKIFEYLQSRGMEFDWYPWHWSYSSGYKDRLLIPFYHEGKIVGWTGRKITNGNPKYLTHGPPGYVFNLDRQINDRKYLIVVEGQLDAISIDGCAIMSNDPNSTQVLRINQLGKQVIVVPDRDKAGSKLVDAAIKNNWGVSVPEWGTGIKDVADAVKKYGRLYSLLTILKYRETNNIKLQLIKKKIESL